MHEDNQVRAEAGIPAAALDVKGNDFDEDDAAKVKVDVVPNRVADAPPLRNGQPTRVVPNAAGVGVGGGVELIGRMATGDQTFTAPNGTDRVRRTASDRTTLTTTPEARARIVSVMTQERLDLGRPAKGVQTSVGSPTGLQFQNEEVRANVLANVQYGIDTNDYSAAQRYIAESLERYPDDPALKQYQRLVEQKVKAPDSKLLSDKIKALAFEPQDTAADPRLAGTVGFGVPQAQAAVAGPAAAGPGLAGPGAVPSVSGPRPSDLRGAAPAVREAFRLISIGDANKAERTLLRHLENDPKDAEAWRMLALAQYRQGHYEQSIGSANEAIALNRGDYHARGLKIRDLMALERWLDAENEASAVLELRPRDGWAFTWRADAREAQGKDELALEDRKAAAEIDPAQFAALYEEALHARKNGRGARVAGGALGKRSALWVGAAGTALLFFSFVLYRKRGDSSVRVALRQDDHDLAVAAAPRVDAVPQGFRVVKTLGQGGMGVVYEAVDLALQRTVALKKMRDEVAANPRERARFLKEARVVAALRHPHIVEIHAIHENADGLFLVFERVPGETLHELLGNGAMHPARALPLLRQVAAALDYAHAQGVVHQDLKPANIMVHGSSVKVMDFGIARRVQETLSTLSRVEVAGTPAYMAPEQEQGGAVGPAADLFALGVCAYEMLTGRLPFPQGGLVVKAQGLYLPATQGTPLPKAVDGELGRALAAVPQGRHASATAFVDALGRALS